MVGWPDQDPVTGDLNLSGGVTLSWNNAIWHMSHGIQGQ